MEEISLVTTEARKSGGIEEQSQFKFMPSAVGSRGRSGGYRFGDLLVFLFFCRSKKHLGLGLPGLTPRAGPGTKYSINVH